MKWQIAWLKPAAKDLERLERRVAEQIVRKVEWLAQNLEQVPHEPLHGRWAGHFKLRVGDWRVVYTIDRQRRLIVVHAVGHRRQIYRQR
jgi:mRNA interferase RelE/StbE